jgi:uncharacterized damage-inducible protein DinB
MNEFDILVEGWNYDLWANTIWREAAEKMPDPKRPKEVLEHMAWAQTTWISRLRHDFALPTGTLEERFKLLNDTWIETVRTDDLRRIVDYKNTSGTAYRRELGAVCRHVIDHGTYHRGQLRGLAELQGWSDFPETGLNGFFITFGLHE